MHEQIRHITRLKQGQLANLLFSSDPIIARFAIIVQETRLNKNNTPHPNEVSAIYKAQLAGLDTEDIEKAIEFGRNLE